MKCKLGLIALLFISGCRWSDPMNFKFVTSGQIIENAPIVSRVIQGRTLLPSTPSDAKITRDAQNNALIQWRRRGRIGYHWRDRAGVPIAEESEYYEIEVISGSTVMHTYRVPLDEAQPIQWEQQNGWSGYVTIATDGSGTAHRSVNLSDPSDSIPVLGSKQRIDGDFVFEFEIYHDGTNVYSAPTPLIDTAFDAAGGDSLGAWLPGASSLTPTLSPSSGPTVAAIAGDRFVMAYTQGVMRFYKNPVSDNSPVLQANAVSQGHGPYWVRVVFPYGDNWGIRNPTLLRFTTPDWTYTAAMQTADGLTPGNPIHLKIYQVSAVSGRGLPLDVTL